MPISSKAYSNLIVTTHPPSFKKANEEPHIYWSQFASKTMHFQSFVKQPMDFQSIVVEFKKTPNRILRSIKYTPDNQKKTLCQKGWCVHRAFNEHILSAFCWPPILAQPAHAQRVEKTNSWWVYDWLTLIISVIIFWRIWINYR